MSDTATNTDITGTDTANNSEQPKGWRAVLPVHPAAELFPLMSKAELRELADDIEANGLLERVTLDWQDDVLCLLEGRNRLDALELLGRKIFVSKYSPDAIGKPLKQMTNKKRVEAIAADHDHSSPSIEIFELSTADDPFAYVLSKNVHRRHLTPEQRRDLIVKVLKARPERSNRQIAAELKVDHKKVAKVRREGEATGEISPVEKTVGKDGKARPSRRHATFRRPTFRHPFDHSLWGRTNEVVESGPVDALCATLAEMVKRNPTQAQTCFDRIVARLRAAMDRASETHDQVLQ